MVQSQSVCTLNVTIISIFVESLHCKPFLCVCVCSHHSSQSDERALDLSVVDILKQIVGLKDVVWLQAVVCDCTDKIPNVFQLNKKEN